MFDLTESQYQVIRFIVAGFVNTIFGYLLYSVFIYFGFHYFNAVLLSTILGVLFNFQTHGRFVFDNSNVKLLPKYYATYALIFVFHVALIGIIKTFGYDDYIAGALSLPFTAIVSFILNKFYVFKRSV